MTVDGLIKRPLKAVRLDPEFFEKPTSVKVGFLPPIAEAKIKEARLGAIEFVPNGSDYIPKRQPDKDAASDIKVRNLKLEYGVREHDITAEGQVAAWGPDLWDALDAADPRILQRVVAEIDAFGRATETRAANPT